jgi:hypothetical protein
MVKNKLGNESAYLMLKNVVENNPGNSAPTHSLLSKRKQT